MYITSDDDEDFTDINYMNGYGDFYALLEFETLFQNGELEEEELEGLTFIYKGGLESTASLFGFSYAQLKVFNIDINDMEIDYQRLNKLSISLFGETANVANIEEGRGSKRFFGFNKFKRFKNWFRNWVVKKVVKSKWTPGGVIRTNDFDGLSVPVAGVLVKVRKWGFLVIRKGITNINGEFNTKRIRTKRVRYTAHFNQPSNFTVKAGTVLWNARYKSKRRFKRERWFPQFSGGRSMFYAQVHNAAFDYYNRAVSEYQLSRPRRTRILASYSNCASSNHRPKIISFFGVADIRVTRLKRNCIYREHDGIYATTVHELTHAGHREMDRGMFSIFESGSCNRKFLKESWAEGVETILTTDRYNQLFSNIGREYLATTRNDNVRFTGWNDRKQAEIASGLPDPKITIMTEYTPIVADLIDDENQNRNFVFFRVFNPARLPPIDTVSGYTLTQIQQALDNCRDIDCWESNLRNYFSNSTENQLSLTFDYVRRARNNNNPKKCD